MMFKRPLLAAALLAAFLLPAWGQSFQGQVGANKILGRDEATTGQVEQLTVAQTNAMLGHSYTAAEYGIVCDGSTNNVSALNTALTAINAAGGGVLVFPEGTCVFSGSTVVTIPSDITIKGQGIDSTIFDWGTGFADTPRFVGFETGNGTPTSNVAITDLTITANGDTSGTATQAISFVSGSDFEVSRVKITSMGQFGIGLGEVSNVLIQNSQFFRTSQTPTVFNAAVGEFSTDGNGFDTYNVRVIGNYSENTTIFQGAPRDSSISYNYCTGAAYGGCMGLNRVANNKRNLISYNVFVDSYNGIDDAGTIIEGIEAWGFNHRIIGNTVKGVAGVGINVIAKESVIVGNNVYDNAQYTSNPQYGIGALSYDSTYNCEGCVFDGNVSTNVAGTTQTYGLVIGTFGGGAPTLHVRLGTNNFSGNATGDINTTNASDMTFLEAQDMSLGWVDDKTWKLTSVDAGGTGPGLRFYHNSASPADFDQIVDLAFFGEDDAGNLQQYGGIGMYASDVSSGTEDSILFFSTITAGSIAQTLGLNGSQLYPVTDDGVSLGASGNRFADLWLATGGIIEWNGAADTTMLCSSGACTVEGVNIVRGSTGSTDDAVLIANSTGGSLLEASDMTFTNSTDTLSINGAGAIDLSLNAATSNIWKLTSTDAGGVGPTTWCYHNSASPAAFDQICDYEFVGKDSAGNDQQYAGIISSIVDTTSTTEDGLLGFTTTTNGTTAHVLTLFGTDFYPQTTDGLALGRTANQWSDLFLAEGGVINWDSGDATITQTGNDIAFAGISSVSLPSASQLNWASSDITETHSTNLLTFSGASSGYRFNSGNVRLGHVSGTGAGFWMDTPTTAERFFFGHDASIEDAFRIYSVLNGANLLQITAATGSGSELFFKGTVKPATNDVGALGTASVAWADLFLASGGTISWLGGDVLLTHSSNALALSGGVFATTSHALTIATGAVTATQSYAVIDTEASAASDDLDTISGGVNGAHLFVSAANDARTVVLKDGTGNIQGPGDCTLDNTQDVAQLIFNSTLSAWLVVACGNNGA